MQISSIHLDTLMCEVSVSFSSASDKGLEFWTVAKFVFKYHISGQHFNTFKNLRSILIKSMRNIDERIGL